MLTVRATIGLALGIALTGCSDSALTQEPQPGQLGPAIAFGQVTDSHVDSRGQATTASNLDEFAVSATVYSPDGSRQLYFAHEEYRFSYIGQDVYRTVLGKVHYWLSQNDEYNFYAYSPSPYIYFEPGVVDKFVFTTPSNVAHMPDIVVATAIAAKYGEPVPLRFTHPLAQVSIYLSEDTRYGKIESITFSGIVDHGEYNMLTGEWLMSQADTDTFVWNCEAYSAPTTDLTGQYYNFFFIPQRLGATAMLTVVFDNLAGYREVHHASLGGSWQAGVHYRYSLTL